MDGREGDWECSSCRNRNYAFRTFCNRCKQPRILVDAKTPADSRWLPRIGDWICTECTNNNYASRDKCKKCGRPKEVASIPALAMPGASLQTYSHYFARAQGGPEQKMNFGLLGNAALLQSFPTGSNWPLGGANSYGIQAASSWPLIGNLSSGFPYANQASQLISKGWRNGDWMCSCGFHNYSTRAQCKRCNASMPPALGTKRLASEELVNEWDNKRLNAGETNGEEGLYGSSFSTGAPALLGKGARQWRDGDWMCSTCNNHNFASRAQCNRCKAERDAIAQPLGVA